MSEPMAPRRSRGWLAALAVAVAATAAIAWSRVGLLDLPAVPPGITPTAAGLADLDEMRRLDGYVRGGADLATPSEATRHVRDGWRLVQAGKAADGLDRMRVGLRLDPHNLVLANAYRMAAFALRRDFLRSARQSAALTPQFPPHLDRQPLAFFEELDAARPARESKLNIAFAWIDEMLLFPALEIKAPASVEAVDRLTEILEGDNPGYVPALYARGLNHLYRPARLVWPANEKMPIDAAATDLGRCVAIGRKLGLGSPRLQATLAIALGDAYVKAGRPGVARSWWQIAQNLAGDDDLQRAIRRRYGWSDEEVLDRLEEELERNLAELERPMTDLALMWN